MIHALVSTILRPFSMSKGDDDDALPPPRRSYMRGARLLLGTAVAGSRMAAASDAKEVTRTVAQRMIVDWKDLLARNAAVASESCLFVAANQV